MDFFITVPILALTLYIYYLWDIYSYWRRRGVAGPMPWPIVGNYGPVILRTLTEQALIQKIYDEYPDERYVGMFIGTTPVLMLKDPQMFKYVLIKDNDTFSQRFVSFAAREYQKNLFTMNGDDQWKSLRRILTPVFTRSNLSQFQGILQATTTKYLDYVDEIIEKDSEQEIFVLKRKYVREVIANMILGVNLGKGNEFEKRAADIESLEGWEIIRILENVFPNVMMFFKLVTSKMAKGMYLYFANIIKKAMEVRKKVKVDGEAKTYLDLLLELKLKNYEDEVVKLEDEHIIQNMVTFTVGTIETIAITMAFVIYRLALSQEIQNKCFEEMSEVLQKHEGKLTFDAVSEMKYFDMVIDETLRTGEQSTFLDRICQTKYRFPKTNFFIDEGVYVYIPVDATHTNEKYFPDPSGFHPDRFSPESKVKITPYTYMPFSEGPRQCVARQFSKPLLIFALASFIRKFSIAPTESTQRKLIFDTAIRFKRVPGGARLGFSRRQNDKRPGNLLAKKKTMISP